MWEISLCIFKKCFILKLWIIISLNNLLVRTWNFIFDVCFSSIIAFGDKEETFLTTTYLSGNIFVISAKLVQQPTYIAFWRVFFSLVYIPWTPIRLGLFEGSFSFGGGGVSTWPPFPPSYLRKNLSNINITLYNC